MLDNYDLNRRSSPVDQRDGPYSRLDPTVPYPRAHEWDAAWVRDDDRSLVLHLNTSAYESVHSVVVDDAGRHVTITVLAGDRLDVIEREAAARAAGQRVFRNLMARSWWIEATAPRPLAGRPVRDGAAPV